MKYDDLPNRDEVVRCVTRSGQVVEGIVGLIWIAMDEPVITLDTLDGTVHIFPTLGDKWGYAP
jgi:hypothetical protein